MRMCVKEQGGRGEGGRKKIKTMFNFVCIYIAIADLCSSIGK